MAEREKAMLRSSIFYSVITATGGISAFELAASTFTNNGSRCPFLLFNTLELPSATQNLLSPRSISEPLWIDDFRTEDLDSGFCHPDHAYFSLILCIYCISVAILYRRHQGTWQLRNLVMLICIAMPVLVGLISGRDIEYISVALVPFAAWGGLAAMPLIAWVADVEHDTNRKGLKI